MHGNITHTYDIFIIKCVLLFLTQSFNNGYILKKGETRNFMTISKSNKKN